MKGSNDGFRALEFETIRLLSAPADGNTTRLYAIDGKLGVWRRVGLREEVPGKVRAWFMGKLVDLVRCIDVEVELAVAGMTFSPTKDELSGTARPPAGPLAAVPYQQQTLDNSHL